MEMVNCPKCGRVFSKGSEPICDDCLKKEEELFERVRTFLEEYPESSLDQVSTATEVSPKKIMKYIKDGRIEISTGMKGELVCSQCGKPIKRGRFCDKCIIHVNNQVGEMFDKSSKSGKPGIAMHTYNKNKK
ncbi:hypothetical protein FACS189490_07200 [Clostridia bacterium]|nr:hypothetical protein FACS189490_07200 [Clostridia bacterium]